MSSPTGRRLEVLATLQAHPGISAPALARRLGVTERTARRDVAHLRELGYRVDAAAGRHGGYTLAQGTAMPPLQLDADEVVAVALGLRSAIGVAGLEEAAATALAKLTETVPRRWRSRLAAVADVQAPPGASDRDVDPGVLVGLALACRAREAVRFRHRSRPVGPARARDAQPLRLVVLSGRWYAVACERGTSAWRTYAVDRISEVRALGIRLPAPPPPPDVTAFVVDALAQGPWRYRVRLRAYTSAHLVRSLLPATVAEVIDHGDTCEIRFGTDDLDWAARRIVLLDVDVDVLEPAELPGRLRALGGWLAERYVE